MRHQRTASSVLSIVRGAKDALARCDCARLEEILVDSEHFGDTAEKRLQLQSKERAEIEAFARFLDVTRENATIIHRSRQLRPGHLEYRTDRGARY
jgi:hypothetical protein